MKVFLVLNQKKNLLINKTLTFYYQGLKWTVDFDNFRELSKFLVF
jgi:hypothetical protein